MLLGGLAALVGGCAERYAYPTTGPSAGTPGPVWPRATPPSGPSRQVLAPPPAPPVEQPAISAAPVKAIPRSSWASSNPVASRLNPMNGVSRITVHHEGWTPVWFADQRTTAARLDADRNTHVRDRGWGDIGYHFMIDRAGRLWEGRSLRFQGAHVKDNNEHNVGVMVLGNFDRQDPTEAQLAALRATVSQLMRHYRVPLNRVYTHQELMSTACPGRALQPRMVSLRRGGYLA